MQIEPQTQKYHACDAPANWMKMNAVDGGKTGSYCDEHIPPITSLGILARLNDDLNTSSS